MQNSLYHFPLSPPPPPRPPPTKQNLTTLYYGLVIIGSTAIVIAIYNLIILKCCPARQERLQRLRDMAASSGRRSLDDFSIHLGATTFKYKKEGQGSLKLGFDNYECPVCLSAFEEEEEVRQLPRCKHSFHVPCIDMWLYSHLDCPLCRAPVELPVFPLETGRNTSEHPREVLTDSGILV